MQNKVPIFCKKITQNFYTYIYKEFPTIVGIDIL